MSLDSATAPSLGARKRSDSDDEEEEGVDSQSKKSRLSSEEERETEDLILSKELMDKPNTTADIWEHFKVYKLNKNQAVCLHCGAEIGCKGGSTKAMRNHHAACQSKIIAAQKKEKFKIILDASDKNKGMLAFLKPAPTFATECTRWIVETKQSFETVENPFFRKMCVSLYSKAPRLTVRSLKDNIVTQVAIAEVVIQKILKDVPFSITSDGWTSRRQHSYTAITVHWINSNWELKSCALGCQPKEGPGSAKQHKVDIDTTLVRFNLQYSNFVASVTDTESTMNLYGNLLEDDRRGCVEWVGCVDHVLELTTGLAFEDTEFSDNTMLKCRGLVGFFHKSSKATKALHDAQKSMEILQPLNVIGDVCTRWWSTFQMTERLLKLKAPIDFLQNNGNQIPRNHRLNDANWKIVKDLVDLLKPFMLAQKLLEGEKFTTQPLIPPVIAKIRSNLSIAQNNVNFSEHARAVASLMLSDFNERWGQGLPGTVFNEHKIRASRDRRKGIHLTTLVAFAMDPRFKDLPGLNEVDRRLLKEEVKRRLLAVPCIGNGGNVPAAPADAAAAAAAIHQLGNRLHDEDEYGPLFADVDAEQNLNRNLNNGGPLENELSIDEELSRYWNCVGLQRVKTVERTKEDGTVETLIVIEDPLLWWKENQIHYPRVAKLARRVLCAPGSSAPSERLFSKAGLTIVADRARLLPDVAASIIFLEDSWKVADSYLQDNMN
jgi:hypothetical protein